MALITIKSIDPFDANNFTGSFRSVRGVGRTLNPTVDVPYGEFMTRMYVGVAGNVSYVKWDGTTQILNNLAAGIWHEILSIMINSASTTATGIVVGS